MGHLLTEEGIKPDPKRTEMIAKVRSPTNVKELKSALGACTYYKRFIKDFHNIASPLYELLKKDIKFVWSEACEKALDILKEELIKHTILTYPDFDSEFILSTDASAIAHISVVTQE